MTINSQIVVNILSQFNDRGMKRFEKNLGLIKKEEDFVNRAFTKFGKDGQTTMKQIQAAAKRTREEMKRFRSEFLSLMFFGMALERAFGGILRASFQTFKKMTEDSSRANNSMTRLTAAWEFFKFTLFEALLRSGVFDKFIQWLIDGIHWFGKLNERGQTLVAEILAIGAAIGAALAAAGIIVMGVSGVGSVMGPISGVASNVTRLLAGVGVIYIAFNSIQSIMDSLDEGQFGDAIHKAITSAMMMGGLVKLARKSPGGGMLFGIGIALDVVDDPVFKNSLSRLFAYFAVQITRFLATLPVLLDKHFIAPLYDAIASAVEQIARVISKIPNMGSTASALFSGASTLRRESTHLKSGRSDNAQRLAALNSKQAMIDAEEFYSKLFDGIGSALSLNFLNKHFEEPKLHPAVLQAIQSPILQQTNGTQFHVDTIIVNQQSSNVENFMKNVITQAQRDGSAPYMN